MIGPRSLIVVNLVNPREKFWGRLHELALTGAYVRGIDIVMVENWARELARDKDATNLGPSDVFLPLWRIEKIFLDEDVGSVRAVYRTFEALVGQSVDQFL